MTIDSSAETLERERPRLVALAYRVLGTLADAEDVVQEAFARWLRLSEAERDGIREPQAWLTRVAGRIALDVLGSARVRREAYVGPWLPEPLPALAPPTADPLDAAARAEEVSSALLVVLETMTPAERVAFVLHDVFAVPFDEVAEVLDRSAAAVRQLATSARRRVEADRAAAVSRAEHDAVVAAFAQAVSTGELEALVRVLDPDAVLRSDGGGVVSAARRPVLGAENVARFLLGLRTKYPEAELAPVATGDGVAFAFRIGGATIGVVNLGVEAGCVSGVWIVMNPAKLGAWG